MQMILKHICNKYISKLENCIRKASDLMKQNSLKLNEDKTEFKIFSNKLKAKDCYSLFVGHNSVQLSDCIQILGVKHLTEK